jgi:2-polyprenyl-3-methyl-5-hydroxy-6-metoxy-1,4-benzoquinol methylase
MTSLEVRSEEPEMMDDLNCGGEVVDQSLRELDFINRWLGGNNVTITGVARLLEGRNKAMPVTIADIGCGGGEMIHKLAVWSRRQGMNFVMTGIDANPGIIRYAEENTLPGQDISFRVMNVLDPSFAQQRFDIVVATLFMHHFTREQLIELFRKLNAQTSIGFVVNDIHRHFLAYHSIRILTRLFSRSAMVIHDAPLSVRRAFSRRDLEDILKHAGIVRYTLAWKWAFRWQLVVNTTTT